MMKMMCGANNIYLSGLDHSEQELNVVENVLEYFLLTDSEVRVVIVGVGADVDDAVHVEVEVIELGAVGVGPGAVHRDDVAVMVPRLVLDDILDDQRVLLAEPAVEGGNSHVDNLGEIVPAAAESAEPLILLTPHEAGRRGSCGSKSETKNCRNAMRKQILIKSAVTTYF
mgnify:CR=1 FL=1